MATTVQRGQMFIGGEWTDGAGPDLQPVLNPSTGEVIAEVPKGTEEDVDRAVKAARKAFEDGWSETTPRERMELMLKLADAIEANGEEFAQIEAKNVGKPLAVTRSEEVPGIVDNLRFFAAGARFMEGKATGEYMKGYTSWIRREPVGVVGSMT